MGLLTRAEATCLSKAPLHKSPWSTTTSTPYSKLHILPTRINGVPAQTGFLRTLTKTIYISAIFSTLNPILSVANLSRLECAETPFAREPRLYEYVLANVSTRCSPLPRRRDQRTFYPCALTSVYSTDT